MMRAEKTWRQLIKDAIQRRRKLKGLINARQLKQQLEEQHYRDMESAYEEGFEAGMMHQESPDEQPVVYLAWIVSKSRSLSARPLSAVDKELIKVWHKMNAPQPKEQS